MLKYLTKVEGNGTIVLPEVPLSEGASVEVVVLHHNEEANKLYDQRPWGEYWVLADTDSYKVKRIHVLPGQRLSYQLHNKRSEHWFIVNGTARVTLNGEDYIRKAGQPVDVPVGTAHRIENIGDEELTFIEVQHGTYFGEDDIIRLQDDYGRAPA